MMTQSWNSFINEEFNKINICRARYPKICIDSRFLVLQNETFLNFISNDYLGLAKHELIKKTVISALDKYGISSTGAASLSGYSAEQELLTKSLANWLKFDNCLLFNSGYQLNVSIYSQLVDKDTIIWLDKSCHASHIDGILLAKCKFNTFTQNNYSIAFEQIKQSPTKRHIILTEGIFSMDGTCSYLSDLFNLKQQFKDNILLIIDDAHGIGTVGERGTGIIEQLGLNINHVDLFIATLGKAFGSHGGFVCASNLLIDYLKQTVRSQIYSTCLPATIIAASNASLSIIKSLSGKLLREKLMANIQYFKILANKLNLNVANTKHNNSAIQLVIFDNIQETNRVFNYLFKKGIMTANIQYPTVSLNSPRIRISITASHTYNDIEILCSALAKSNSYQPIIRRLIYAA